MDWEVRTAAHDDETALLELWEEFTNHLSGFDSRYYHQDSAEDNWLSYYRNQILNSEYGTIIVAESGDNLVGVVEARVRGGHPIFKLRDHGYITGLYVQEGRERLEIGQELIVAVEEWLEDCPRDIKFYRTDIICGDTYTQEILEETGHTVIEQVYEKKI